MEYSSNNPVIELHTEVSDTESKALWVFAYGSLCWKPGFEFHKAVAGHIQGYHRRFWQGNITHRGTEENPGRVATLVEVDKGKVNGLAFAVTGEAAIPYLSNRECELGGYISQFTEFYPKKGKPFKVLLYVATPKNDLWLGEAAVEDMAYQIVKTKGPSGYNAEYLIRLANFMRHHFPTEEDEHLFNLENAVLLIVNKERLCTKTLMGDGEGCVTFVKRSSSPNSSRLRQGEQERIESFEHTTRVPGKTLRCLNI